MNFTIIATLTLFANLIIGVPFFGSPCLAGGTFPIYPGAVKDSRQGGATSLQPGKNYSVSVYTVEAPLEEVLRFYQTRLKDSRQSEASDGSIELKTDGCSVRLMKSGPLTKIQITQGPS